ncbi:hypothetical protein FAIPA1_210069 [Frankia sp. AiPs1]
MPDLDVPNLGIDMNWSATGSDGPGGHAIYPS